MEWKRHIIPTQGRYKMKATTGLLGIIVIIAGLTAVAYEELTHPEQVNLTRSSEPTATASKQQDAYFSPALGAIAIISGIALVAFLRRK
tara:strand:- start:433 stop:699 length:267 start_codon:yes stop_codon:yes gene_type:complete